MYRIKKISIYASEISEFLNLKLTGKDVIVNTISSVKSIQDNSILFIPKISENLLKIISMHNDLLIVTSQEINNLPDGISVIYSNDAKIDFINLVNNFFIEIDSVRIAESASIHPEAQLGKNISIGENCVIGGNVSISDNTIIQNNVVISGCVSIGEECIIKNNATIGSEGYKFEKNKDGNLLHAPQIGKINIGNRVWIGSNTCVESSYIDETTIEDGAKIDDLVQIGYNCYIGSNTMITAGVIMSNNVTINTSAFIGLNSSIKENVTIGHNTIIGMGSVVLKNIEEESVYIGNPAKFLRKSLNGGE
jgi:UDP-3-O-[3-hydroxymyristoyl] glucosamine N-acyltransferase